ncbi:MAG: WbqC family protein [Pseudomonadota bacterium]
MTTVVISQPMYFPWPGFLAQMALADVFIWLDDAQFSKGSFTNRVQVRIGDAVKWMTVPLAGKGSHQIINDLEPATPGWSATHRDLLRGALQGRPRLEAALACFDGAIAGEEGALSDLLIRSAEGLAEVLGIQPSRILKSSAMNVAGSGSARVLALVRAVSGTRYVTGHGAAGYLDHERFEAAGVEVAYMDYQVRPWDQGDIPFSPYVTALDLLSALPGAEARPCLNPVTRPWRAHLEATR